MRLSLNDANKFDYFWFQILPLLLLSSRTAQLCVARRVECDRDDFPRVGRAPCPTNVPPPSTPAEAPRQRIYFTTKQKISERFGLRCLGLCVYTRVRGIVRHPPARIRRTTAVFARNARTRRGSACMSASSCSVRTAAGTVVSGTESYRSRN